MESIGINDVAPMLARVRLGREGAPRPLGHLLLRVVDQGRAWLADVGFGGGGLLDPLPFETGVETEQSGWRYRLVEDGPELLLQSFTDGSWADCYGFVPEPVPHVDIEVNNWYTATNPNSPFVNEIMTGSRLPDRCLSLFVHEQTVLIERPVGEVSNVTELETQDAPAILAKRFGIEGVELGADGRLGLRAT